MTLTIVDYFKDAYRTQPPRAADAIANWQEHVVTAEFDRECRDDCVAERRLSSPAPPLDAVARCQHNARHALGESMRGRSAAVP